MLQQLLGLSILSVLSSSLASAAPVTIHCPSSNDVTVHSIPHSVNSYFTATSDGVAFGGFGVGWIKGFPLAVAQVGEVNGNWSLTCGYGQSGFMETLSTGNSPVFANCKFANGSQTCKGTIARCALTCPSPPAVPKVQAAQGAKP
jgi:hypothetical protein